MRVTILLTGCINPDGMSFTRLTDTNERMKQYVDAIHYYLEATNNKIVFCENSNTNISSLFENNKNSNRLKILTFSGNKEKQKGKGYGEAEIIEYAFQHSSWLKENNIVIKITGRLIVNNICQIIKSLQYNDDFVTCLFHSDLSFADSRIFCATPAFYKEFLRNKNRINDSEGRYFEHLLSYIVIESSIQFIPFTEEPQITGMSGSSGNCYQAKKSTKKQQLLFKRYSLEQLYKINNKSRNKHQGLYKKTILMIKITGYKLLVKYLYILFFTFELNTRI